MGFWVRLAMGVAAIALLIAVGVYMVEYLINAVMGLLDGGVIPDDGSGDYAVVTPEPMPTIPPYMLEDSFYDDAGSVGDE